MQLFVNLKISVKILLVIALMLVATAIISWQALSGIRELTVISAKLDADSDRAENAGRGTANMLMWVRMVEFYNTEMPGEQFQKVVATAKDERRRMQARIDNLGKLDDGSYKQEIAQLQKAIGEYDQEDQQILALVNGQKTDDATRATLAAAVKVDAIRRGFRAIEEKASQQITESVKRTNSEGERVSRNVLLVAVVGGIAGLLTAVLVAIFGISRPLLSAIGAMNRIAGDDLEAEIRGTDRTDEIGQIAKALLTFRQNAVDKKRAETEAAEQRRLAEEQRSAREARERTAIEEISALCEKAVAGDLATRIDETGKDGFLLTISQRLNGLTNMLQQMTGEMAKITAAMAEGDLTNSIRGSYDGVFGTLKDSVNTMAQKLGNIAGSLNESSRAVKDAAAEISTGSQDLAQRTESQAASIEETAASMHEITTTVKQNADNAAAANQLASVARDAADKGGAVMTDVVKAMERIEGSAGKISEIVGMIDEIAFQTNLLALNASVEAARAGEAGKGFAVVAQEVRALAQRSANASKEIKTLITASNGQVREGGQLVGQAGSSLSEIVGAVKKVSDIVAEITAASREQATGLEQINTAVAQMDETTQRNGALVEQTSAAAQSLSQQADQLSQLVSFFRTGATAPTSASRTRPVAAAVQVTPIAKAAPKHKPVPAMKHVGSVLKQNAEQDWQEF